MTFDYMDFLQKFDFTKSDLSVRELERLAKILLADNDVYSHNIYDIGKTKQQLHIPLKKTPPLKNKGLVKYRSIYAIS